MTRALCGADCIAPAALTEARAFSHRQWGEGRAVDARCGWTG